MSSHHNPGDEFPEGDKPLPNSAADDFFVKMNRQFRRPRPSEEAVAAALQAIQTLAGEVVTGESNAPADEPQAEQCPKCGGVNAESNRFCGFCGAVVDRTQKLPAKPVASASPTPSPTTPGQHIYHHHYHHHYFPGSSQTGEAPPVATTETTSTGAPPIEPAGAELAPRQLVQDWTLKCNAKSFNDLANLYCLDAILVRPDATLLRGRSSIQQYLEAAIEAGLSDVQLELTDTRLLGTVACLAGVSQILVPAWARGQTERTGKFLMLLRNESGMWRILADIWCMNRDPFPAENDSLAQGSESIPAPATAERKRVRYTR